MKRFGAVILVLFAFSALNLCGQALTSLNGTVSDPSGAVVAGASVTLTNLLTGAQRQDKSDTAGRYGFQQVQPGRYKLGASAAGFTRLKSVTCSGGMYAGVPPLEPSVVRPLIPLYS